jgi:hypothetical protein
MNDLCMLDHGDDERRALPGLRLCGSHRDRLERDLRDLPGLHDRLGDHLGDRTEGGAAQFGGGIPTPGTPKVKEPLTLAETSLPINPAIADLRDQIRHDLVFWCLFVAEKRRLASLPDDTVPAITRWLLGHVEWIAGHEAAAVECPPVFRDLAGRAHRILNPSGAKRIGIGPCRDSVEAGPCGGTLWATCRAEDDPKPSEVYCDGPCGMSKSPEEWRRWGREYLRGKVAS